MNKKSNPNRSRGKKVTGAAKSPQRETRTNPKGKPMSKKPSDEGGKDSTFTYRDSVTRAQKTFKEAAEDMTRKNEDMKLKQGRPLNSNFGRAKPRR